MLRAGEEFYLYLLYINGVVHDRELRGIDGLEVSGYADVISSLSERPSEEEIMFLFGCYGGRQQARFGR